ncbi:class II aaRS and biotin synthetase, partial [Jaminaea rosea]
MNHLGNKAADAQKSVAAFLKQNKMKKGPRIKEDEERLRGEAKELSNQMTALRQEHDQLGQDITALLLASPNVSHESAPIGSESQAKVSKESATIRRTHLGLATLLSPSGQIDTPAGRLATGPSFPYLTDSVALLEQALLRYSTDIALAKGYRLVSTPAVVRTDVAERCGFDPRGGEGGQTYFVSSSSSTSSPEENGHPDLCLIGTAEIALAALVSGRTFPRSSLPLRLLAISPSFRAEAGGRGQETKGLYRLHQFMKAEMFVVAAPPSEESGETHPDLLEELRAIQEQVFSSLGLTTRTLLMPTEELGASAHRKYDIEAWMPGRGSDQDGGGWGEVSSASDCTDYQASRLAINVEGVSTPAKEQKKQKPATSTPAHTLNATLLAAPRVIIALME